MVTRDVVAARGGLVFLSWKGRKTALRQQHWSRELETAEELVCTDLGRGPPGQGSSVLVPPLPALGGERAPSHV